MNLGCRHCRHYQIEGRRWGHCQLLGVQVQGAWSLCSQGVPAFAPSWESSGYRTVETPEGVGGDIRDPHPPPFKVALHN